MFKTVEEMKAALPELCKELIDSAIVSLKSEHEAKVSELEEKLQDSETKVSEKTDELGKLVDSIKVMFPDKFTVVQESEIVSEKENALNALEEEINAQKAENESLKAQIKESNDGFVKKERDGYVEHIKTIDPAFFEFESFKDCFENCLTKDEVQQVYESNSKIVKELKDKVSVQAAGKSKQIENPSAGMLTDEQKKDFEKRNAQRLRVGLELWNEAKYLEMFGTK